MATHSITHTPHTAADTRAHTHTHIHIQIQETQGNTNTFAQY